MNRQRAIKLALALIGSALIGLLIVKGSLPAVLLAFVGLVLVVLL
jgi:hypothetical protein